MSDDDAVCPVCGGKGYTETVMEGMTTVYGGPLVPEMRMRYTCVECVGTDGGAVSDDSSKKALHNREVEYRCGLCTATMHTMEAALTHLRDAHDAISWGAAMRRTIHEHKPDYVARRGGDE